VNRTLVKNVTREKNGKHENEKKAPEKTGTVQLNALFIWIGSAHTILLYFYRWINCIAEIAPKKKIVGTPSA